MVQRVCVFPKIWTRRRRACIIATMAAKRVRVIFDTDERIRYALQLHSLRARESVSDTLNRLIAQNFPEELDEAHSRIPDDEPPPTPKRRGRPPKPPA